MLISWPHADSDWAEILPEVEDVYGEIARAVTSVQNLVILGQDREHIAQKLRSRNIPLDRVTIYPVLTNDTWIRDYGPLTVFESGRPVLLDFTFNGWGLKFAANYDNQSTAALCQAGFASHCQCQVPGFVLEGGSIESDGDGTILTTSACLLEPNRNPHLNRQEIEEHLLDKWLGASHVLWLEHGALEGDDTDAHIDTLVRLCPGDTLTYVSCDDPSDSHYHQLQTMKQELQQLRTRQGKPFHLVPLPWPQPCYHPVDGHRLPATYANFLIINGAVLMPTYGDTHNDSQAVQAMQDIFPTHRIIPIDCRALIQQHGSLHCATMQIPAGVLKICANHST